VPLVLSPQVKASIGAWAVGGTSWTWILPLRTSLTLEPNPVAENVTMSLVSTSSVACSASIRGAVPPNADFPGVIALFPFPPVSAGIDSRPASRLRLDVIVLPP